MTGPQNNTVVPDDPFGRMKKEAGRPGLEPREVAKIHANDDVDSNQQAHHHTIGIKHDQSSAGDHVHDGSSSRKIGAGMGLTVGGAKGGNVALANLLTMLKQVIEFTDTTT